MKKNITFHTLSAAIWGCFPIISKADKENYVKPFRQYKDLSDKVELYVPDDTPNSIQHNVKHVYWTTIPAMFLCYLSDMFGFKEECLDFLGMGVTKHEGHSEYQRYVDHFGLILEKASAKQKKELSEGERMFLRKLRLVRIKLNNTNDAKTMHRYD